MGTGCVVPLDARVPGDRTSGVMLRNASKLERCELRAREGKIGHADDLLFDDRHWTVRYLVADTGTWLARRRVLISPVALAAPEWERHMIPVQLTRDQVRLSPPVETVQPISREQEELLTHYYSWPAYWGGAGPTEGANAPLMPADLEASGGGERGRFPPRRVPARASVPTVPAPGEAHLRSMREVAGYTVHGADGVIGHVDDFLLNDRTWGIAYLVVDSRKWLPGRKVLVATSWVDEVGWKHARIQVSLSRAAVKSSPAYDPSEPLSAEYIASLHEHYGRLRYSP